MIIIQVFEVARFRIPNASIHQRWAESLLTIQQFAEFRNDSSACFDVQALVGLSDSEHKLVVSKNAASLIFSVGLDALSPNCEPIGRRKIHRFGDVEPAIEAGMVGARKRDNEFARVLSDRVDRNAVVD